MYYLFRSFLVSLLFILFVSCSEKISYSGKIINYDSYDYTKITNKNEVLNNILVNAAEAVEGVGEISIRVSPIREGVRFSVKDRGVGMNSREQKNAFQLFHTTKREGTGLGLPIVRKIMDLHGGRVSLVSVLGRGTEVRLDFPIGEESRCVS